MHLERIEISGFRGIKRLSLELDDIAILIGENTWGKSSLLDALTIALSPEYLNYRFKIQDFHIDLANNHRQTSQLQIILKWVELKPNQCNSARYKIFHPYWISAKNFPDKLSRLYYIINAEYNLNLKFKAYRGFLDLKGNLIHPLVDKRLIEKLIALHPVIRLQDSRRLRDNGEPSQLPNLKKARHLDSTVKRLQTRPGNVSSEEIKSGIKAMQSLFEHYFSFKLNSTNTFTNEHFQGAKERNTSNPLTAIASFRELLAHNSNKQTDILLMSIFSNFVRAQGEHRLLPCARPLWIFEEPEARLHPILLNQVWLLLQAIPMQKILTTNSSILLASTSNISHIKRLVRKDDGTQVFQIRNNLLSKDAFRRIAFHIQMHHPAALFARTWLLVEGETEVWIFAEFARISGYNLAAEGIQIIEFAQSGLKPLIKIAKALGIEWHMVTDGDSAGKKYFANGAKYVERENIKAQITMLPAKDMEHYLYQNGFEAVFRKLSGLSNSPNIKANKIIHKALNKHAKPDIALAMVNYSKEHNNNYIPDTIRLIIKRIVNISRRSFF